MAIHHLSLKSRKTSLYYMSIAVILFSAFYLIGFWQHNSTRRFSDSIDCKTILSNRTIDFAAHHLAEKLVPFSEDARAVHLPPCDGKLSEYTPCQDIERSLKFDRNMLVYKERHCPEKSEMLKCRIPAPHGYKTPFRWPQSRDVVWYANVPHKHLTVEKAGQNWVRFEGDRFSFPGGGTMFRHGADAYIDDIGKLVNLRDGSIRTAIDTGCGVASWGAYLLSRGILPMSFAPKDTHEAQVQFALERGVPALIGIMATNRLPYPARAFDMAHCSRCLIPWKMHGGLYLIEVDRILRPGGYWILSGPPVNWKNHWQGWNRTAQDLKADEDAIDKVAKSLCWKKLGQRGDIVVWQKPTHHNDCKSNRPFCTNQNPDFAWYTKMEACITPLPGGQVQKWPERLIAVPPRILSGNIKGVTAESFEKDTELWKKIVSRYKAIDSQLAEHGRYRNLLDMNAGLGGFAAAMVDDPVWVMNTVPAEAEVDTLGVIYERGLIGTYQNWCEAMSTYPRTYDFIHASSIFTLYKDRCGMEDILLEMDRILRPQGSVIIRDDVDVLVNVRSIVDGMEWESRMTDHEGGPHVREKLLIATKKYWTLPVLDQGPKIVS